ncbi:MAG: class II aldolase/adducin family protein [Lacrimispora sp.]|uniref:class II aldolase/adducin family protein n=1 Tax=Lacrimispora sp. TaxID=2719234 RepID=UPI0039E591E1
MDQNLDTKIAEAIWIGKSLFDRGKTSGSSANLSFRHDNYIYITGSNTCFGNLDSTSFGIVDMEGNYVSGIAPSKELPLHFMLYKRSDKVQAVIHTHSFYSILWSCLEHECEEDCIPAYTPYLKMKLGTVGLIPYAKPGSEELFDSFAARMDKSNGYLLRNHGPVVADKDLMSAFYCLEELEESARVAWELTGKADVTRIIKG